MPENLRGTLTPFTLPPKSQVWPELQGPIEEYRELIQKRHVEHVRLGKLENDRARALEADRRALAKALRQGGEDPGDKKIKEIDRKLAETRRTIEALEIAIYEAEADLVGVVDEHQSEWLENTTDEIAQVAQEYLVAVEAIEAAREKLISSVALKRFLHTFPEHGYQPGHWPVYGLIGRNEEPFRWDQVTEALRKDAEVATKPPREPQPEATGPIVEHLHNAPGMDEVAFGPGAVRSY
jgi:ribosomal 50S subunit-associated protein YjgA (DUF615 family)